jgi:hypothetical protein
MTIHALTAVPRNAMSLSRRMPLAGIALFQDDASKLESKSPDQLLYRNGVKGRHALLSSRTSASQKNAFGNLTANS